MGRLALAWIAAALSFVAMDAVWLSQVAPRLDMPLIGEILTDKVDFVAATIFYLIYITGIISLAVAPAMHNGGVKRATLLGAILGLVAYGSYDLTNQATLKVWDVRVTLADMAWGVVITTAASAIACAVASRFGKRG
jgi:uncharacterized membrane protein